MLPTPPGQVLGRPTSGPITAGELSTWSAPPGQSTVEINTRELTAFCPVTEQPDFYRLTIRYEPRTRIVELKALKLYLWSFRDRRIGVEGLAAEIRDSLVALLTPAWLVVELTQDIRGGLETTASAAYAAPKVESGSL